MRPSAEDRLTPANDELLLATEAASVLPSLEAVAAGELAGFVIGMLPHRKPQSFCDAVVTNGRRCQTRDEAGDEIPD